MLTDMPRRVWMAFNFTNKHFFFLVAVCFIFVSFYWFNNSSVKSFCPAELRKVDASIDLLKYSGSKDALPSYRRPPSNCMAREDVVFIKTRKCFSSTVQNVLLRYGDTHNLTFLLPPYSNRLCYPREFARHCYMHVPDERYNVICHHARFDPPVYQSVMPDSTVYVTIIREPTSMYHSLFSYINAGVQLNYTSPTSLHLRTYLKEPTWRFHDDEELMFNLRHPMSFDLGLWILDYENDDEIDKMLRSLDEMMSVVMIAERFDESLILLRDALCWSSDDVLALPKNTRVKAAADPFEFDARDEARLRRWNHADYKLYDHFLRKHEDAVETFGKDRMKKEVSELQQKRQALEKRCVGARKLVRESWRKSSKDGTDAPDTIVMELSESGLKDPLCQRLVRTETEYTKILQERHVQKYGRILEKAPSEGDRNSMHDKNW